MRIFTCTISLQKKLVQISAALTALLLFSSSAMAQTRTYSLVYSENLKGNTTVFGNTLLNIVDNNKVNTTKMNDNSKNGNSSYGNDNENMVYVDIDGSSGNGSVTRNSSSADLILPAGTNTIKLARLYWGGRISNSDFDLSKKANKTIKIRKGTTNTYSDVTALGIDQTTIVSGVTEYQAYADITTFIKNNGGGTYTVGNVPLSTGAVADGGNHGGWAIVVVYENLSMPFNSVRLYDGFQVVYNGGSSTVSTVNLTGLDVPSGAMAATDAKMSVVAWEGDANLKGDFLKINGNTFSNATNPSDNPWNGTITDNGVHVTTKNPNYTNQMGIDIDMFNVGSGYGINPNATTVKLEFGTEQDKYYPGVFTFTIKMKDPTITLDKIVSDANHNNLAESGEILTYTLKGGNYGVGNANNVIVADTLPSTVTYVPGSLKVISSPGVTAGTKTDKGNDDIAEYTVNGSIKSVVFRLGTGATKSAGGTLAANETYEVQFQVKVNDPGKGVPVPSILNIARVTSNSDAGVNFVDDGTAIINPEAGPMPVTLTKFGATLLPNKFVKVDWTTTMEINSNYFIVQKSNDGSMFSDLQTVGGNGTTNNVHNYSITDSSSSFSSTVYYRLKQVDLDGKVNMSRVVSVKTQAEAKTLVVSPNPFADYVNVSASWDQTEIVTIKIFTVQGKEVFSKQVTLNKGMNSFKIESLGSLPSGMYLLQMASPTQKLIEKMIK